jgi:hypothetical protein
LRRFEEKDYSTEKQGRRIIVITFFVCDENTLYRLICRQRACGGPRIAVRSYRWLFSRTHLPSSTYIFADLERLGEGDLDRAATIHQRICAADPGLLLLNHPRRTLRRYDLLERLAASGINSYRAYRVTDGYIPQRFPIFLRGENDHDGPVSDLIWTIEEYRANLRKGGVLESGKHVLAVEFLDYRDTEGRYVKFGAIVVGSTIWTNHALVSHQWMVKSADIVDETVVAFEHRLQEEQPHAALLRPAIDIAGAQYGRADYCIVNGRAQLFEFNTNPSFFGGARRDHPRISAAMGILDFLLGKLTKIQYSGLPRGIHIQSSREAGSTDKVYWSLREAYRGVQRERRISKLARLLPWGADYQPSTSTAQNS